jgi:hypothetical protein
MNWHPRLLALYGERLMSIVGHLHNGFFFCVNCIEKEKPNDVTPVAVHDINISPYSQVCSGCHRLVMDGLKGLRGHISLFPVSDFCLDSYASKSESIGDSDPEAQSCNDRDMIIAFVRGISVGSVANPQETAKNVLEILRNQYQRII